MAAAEDYLQAHLAQDMAIKDAAAHLGISVSALNAYFKRSRAMTAANYLRELRLNKARQLLQTTKGKLSIAAIAAQCGYKNHSKFSAAFKQRFGQSPHVAGFEYKVTAVSLGLTLLAALAALALSRPV